MIPRSDPPPPESPLLSRNVHRRSAVARPARSVAFHAGLVLAAILGVLVFSALDKHRQAEAQTRIPIATTEAQARAQAEAQAPAPAASPLARGSLANPQSAALASSVAPSQGASSGPAWSDEAQNRWKAPALVVDLGSDPQGQEGSDAQNQTGSAPAQVSSAAEAGSRPLTLAQAGPESAAAGGPGTGPSRQTPKDSLSPEERFSERVGGAGVDTAYATRLADTALIAPQGTVIPAILETAINSDLPGFTRAVVSRDVRGFDGSTVLIPRGSKLIGQYRSGQAVGQSRAFVVWSRIITPDGVSVEIASPGADRLGQGGVPGETNTHFFQRFGASILLSVLSAGLESVATSNSTGNTAIVIGSPQQANNIAAIALQKRIDIPDTITVPQGAPIRVFVARDLDFTGVVRRASGAEPRN